MRVSLAAVAAVAALVAPANADGSPLFTRPKALHFPLYRRGGIFAGANWTADLPYLLEQVHLAESRFNLTQREVRGNKVVRVPKDGAQGGGEASTLLGEIGGKDRWYSKMGFGAQGQPVEVDIDMLSSDFAIRSTTSHEGTRFDEIFSNTYSSNDNNQPFPSCKWPEDQILLPGKAKEKVRMNFAHCRPRPQSRETLLASGGIMGLAPAESLRQMNVPTFLDTLVEKKLIQHKVFSATIINGREGLLSVGGTAAEHFAQVAYTIDTFLGKQQEIKVTNLQAIKVEDDEQDEQDKIDAANGAPEDLLGASKGESKVAEGEAKEDKPAEDKPDEEKAAEEKPAQEKSAEEKPAEEKPAGGALKKLKRGLEDMAGKVLEKRGRQQHQNNQAMGPTWRDDWKWSPVEGAEGWWQTLMRGVWVDDTKVLKNQPCVIDMNIPFVLAPPLAVKQFYSSISGTFRLPPPYQNFFAFPCNNPPTLQFEFGGWRFPVMRGMKTYDSSNGPNGKFSLGKVSWDSGYCVGAVVETKMGVGDQAPVKRHSRGKTVDNIRAINAMEAGMLAGNGMRDVWVLGEPAFRGLGLAFDIETKEVGFRTY